MLVFQSGCSIWVTQSTLRHEGSHIMYVWGGKQILKTKLNWTREWTKESMPGLWMNGMCCFWACQLAVQTCCASNAVACLEKWVTNFQWDIEWEVNMCGQWWLSKITGLDCWGEWTTGIEYWTDLFCTFLCPLNAIHSPASCFSYLLHWVKAWCKYCYRLSSLEMLKRGGNLWRF